jgi:hypothetical protein
MSLNLKKIVKKYLLPSDWQHLYHGYIRNDIFSFWPLLNMRLRSGMVFDVFPVWLVVWWERNFKHVDWGRRPISSLLMPISERLLFNTNSAIFQLYHGESKLIINERNDIFSFWPLLNMRLRSGMVFDVFPVWLRSCINMSSDSGDDYPYSKHYTI